MRKPVKIALTDDAMDIKPNGEIKDANKIMGMPKPKKTGK